MFSIYFILSVSIAEENKQTKSVLQMNFSMKRSLSKQTQTQTHIQKSHLGKNRSANGKSRSQITQGDSRENME